MSELEKFNRIHRRAQEARVARTSELFGRSGIPTLLIKGWAAARYYPLDRYRSTGDIDISVCAADYDKALSIATSPEGRELIIDLHHEFRGHDTTDWRQVYNRAKVISVDGTEVRVPAPEDHLRILCSHWLQDGGEYKEKLWDVFYLIDSCRQSFDWKKCLDPVPQHRRRWVLICVGLANRYLGLDLAGIPFDSDELSIPNWVSKRLEKDWSSGEHLAPLDLSRGVVGLLKQIRKRLPPSPIQATVDVDGSFDTSLPFMNQLRSILKRGTSSLTSRLRK